MEKQSDLYYIDKIRAGDLNYFAVLVERYEKRVLNWVLKIIANTKVAEDITQEIFIKIFQKLNSFKGTSEFSTWLYRIAYNTALSEWKKHKHMPLTSIDKMDIAEETDLDEHDERIESLLEALRNLKPEDALMVSLFYMNDQSIESISNIVNLSVANVKVRLHRIRKKLKEDIQKGIV